MTVYVDDAGDSGMILFALHYQNPVGSYPRSARASSNFTAVTSSDNRISSVSLNCKSES